MISMSTERKERYELTLAKINALCRGFLLAADRSSEKATGYCRGILILMVQLSMIKENSSRNHNSM